MVEIIDGVLHKDELTKNSRGGTEQMADRLLKYVDKKHLKDVQIIFSRPQNLFKNKYRILYCHDLANDPAVSFLREKKNQDLFDHFVFVSRWQQEMFNLYLGVPYSKGTVIHNFVDFLGFNDNDDAWSCDRIVDHVRLIYHTTPHRGLDILYEAFDEIYNEYDFPVTLDVFSSFKIYGWEERDKPYEELFEKLKKHPNITYHGTQPNEVVRKYLEGSNIFAYPNTWLETSCLAAIEAQEHACAIVAPHYGALTETIDDQTFMYDWTEDRDDHKNRFKDALTNAITKCYNKKTYSGKLETQSFCGPDIFKNKWTKVLINVKAQREIS